MPEEDLARLEGRIARAVEPGFRGRLVSQGLARSMIWSGGLLPEGSPSFSPRLTPDLLSYGFALLNQALRLREAGGRANLQRRAFELAAESIESVVRSGDPESRERGFHQIVAAAAYHLAHFSARSYSLVPRILEGLNLSPAETALALLLRRRLDDLRARTLTWLTDPSHSDEAMAALVENSRSDSAEDQVVELALNTVFHRALALFQHALESGDADVVPSVHELLQEGETLARRFGAVALWWIFILTRHLLDDLWDQSLHRRLPEGPDGDDDETAVEWRRLRRTYIAVLSCRELAEVELWPSQIEAAERALDVTDDLVVALPTSAGKTRIAELCILRALALKRRVVFVTPLRALSAQTERSLRKTFTELGFTVTSLYGASGSSPLEADTLRNRDIVVATPEKLDFALRNNPSLLNDVGLVVFDEAHMIGMGDREVRYEVLVQALLRRGDATERRVVCLSALLPEGPDLDDFVAWIRQDAPGEPINCEWRPTRRRFGEVHWQGNRARYQARVGREETFIPAFFVQAPPKGRRQKPFPKDRLELTLATAWRLAEDFKTTLIYCPLRRSVEKLARDLLKLLREGYLPSLWLGPQTEELRDAQKIGAEWLGADHPAIGCLSFGVAVHHGQLPRPFQRAVETLLAQGKLRVTIASPTLAQGLNLSAHTLIFYSLNRGSEPIPASEFANVTGRAGRAFVDLEGQVLCPFYGNEGPSYELSWRSLISESRTRRLTSGLVTLVLELARRIIGRCGGDLPTFLEYLCGNAAAWEAPPDPSGNSAPERKEKEFLGGWDAHVASLDCALLSLLSDRNEMPESSLAGELDALLASSLWERTLRRVSSGQQAVAKAILAGRAGFLWRNSTSKQRRGYFFAGVGLTTGAQLDLHAERLNLLLTEADRAVWEGTIEPAVAALTEFAKLVFEIPPFQPRELPERWEGLLAGWIRGQSVSTLKANEPIGDFIESALVYRLVWAMEAVRVRAVAHEEWIEQPTDGAAAAAVETGTPSVPCALLVQNGLPSRAAAIHSMALCETGFKSVTGMRAWLQLPNVRAAARTGSWPTPETASLWLKFVREQDAARVRVWREERQTMSVNWDQVTATPSAGVPVRLIKEQGGGTGVYSLDMRRLGVPTTPLTKLPRGIMRIWIADDQKTLHFSRIGPSSSVEAQSEFIPSRVQEGGARPSLAPHLSSTERGACP